MSIWLSYILLRTSLLKWKLRSAKKYPSEEGWFGALFTEMESAATWNTTSSSDYIFWTFRLLNFQAFDYAIQTNCTGKLLNKPAQGVRVWLCPSLSALLKINNLIIKSFKCCHFSFETRSTLKFFEIRVPFLFRSKPCITLSLISS